MSRFKSYIPEQSYLLPPSVQEELSGDHLCFFIRRVVERLELRVFEQAYAAEGGALYGIETYALTHSSILDKRGELSRRH